MWRLSSDHLNPRGECRSISAHKNSKNMIITIRNDLISHTTSRVLRETSQTRICTGEKNTQHGEEMMKKKVMNSSGLFAFINAKVLHNKFCHWKQSYLHVFVHVIGRCHFVQCSQKLQSAVQFNQFKYTEKAWQLDFSHTFPRFSTSGYILCHNKSLDVKITRASEWEGWYLRGPTKILWVLFLLLRPRNRIANFSCNHKWDVLISSFIIKYTFYVHVRYTFAPGMINVQCRELFNTLKHIWSD